MNLWILSSRICYQWRVSGNVHNKPVVTCYHVTNAMHNDDSDQAWNLCSAPTHHCTECSPVIISCYIHSVSWKSEDCVGKQVNNSRDMILVGHKNGIFKTLLLLGGHHNWLNWWGSAFRWNWGGGFEILKKTSQILWIKSLFILN